jgi:hypothetical protein
MVEVSDRLMLVADPRWLACDRQHRPVAAIRVSLLSVCFAAEADIGVGLLEGKYRPKAVINESATKLKLNPFFYPNRERFS